MKIFGSLEPYLKQQPCTMEHQITIDLIPHATYRKTAKTYAIFTWCFDFGGNALKSGVVVPF